MTIVTKGMGAIIKNLSKKPTIKKRGMSTEDKIKTGAAIGTGAAITGLGVVKAKSIMDQDYGKAKKKEDKE